MGGIKMNNKVSIRDLIKESDIQILTDETFGKNKKGKRFIKKLAPIAACAVIVLGVINYDVVYGSINNLFTYVMGIGIQSSENLDYYTLNSPIELDIGGENIKIEYVYRHNDTITVLIESKGDSPVKCSLIIDGKRHESRSGVSSASNIAISDEVSDRKEELIFENVKKSNSFILKINDEYEANIELSKPNPITHMVNQDIKDYKLTIVSLSSDNSKIGIHIKPMKNINDKLEYNIRDMYFIDEYGNKYLAMKVGLSGNEFKPFEVPEGKIIGIEGGTIVCGISRAKIYNYITTFKLPNPKINESIPLDTVIKIKDFPDIKITQIARDKDGLLSVTKEIDTDEYSSWSFDISILNKSSQTTEQHGEGSGNIQTISFIGDKLSDKEINFGLYNFEVYSTDEWLINLD